jgi:hypothetical protein
VGTQFIKAEREGRQSVKKGKWDQVQEQEAGWYVGLWPAEHNTHRDRFTEDFITIL